MLRMRNGEQTQRMIGSEQTRPTAQSRREFLQRGRHLPASALGRLGFCTSWAVDNLGGGPEWLEICHADLPIASLPRQFVGKKVVHITDLHLGRSVSAKYLHRCVERINALEPDFVLLTGDYVTHDLRGRYRRRVAELLSGLQANLGVFACLGNHDYSWRKEPVREKQMAAFSRALRDAGVQLLRNEARRVHVGEQSLCFVGVGDMLANDFHPAEAFAGVRADETVLVLVHNPRAVDLLAEYPAAAYFAGHTHGQERKLAMDDWVIRKRLHYAGMYELAGRALYVNRGLGRLGSFRPGTRPEIAVLTLR